MNKRKKVKGGSCTGAPTIPQLVRSQKEGSQAKEGRQGLQKHEDQALNQSFFFRLNPDIQSVWFPPSPSCKFSVKDLLFGPDSAWVKEAPLFSIPFFILQLYLRE